jgi:hypothetical protein
MATSLHPGADLSLPLQWVDFEETPIVFSNHFLAQHQLIELLQATLREHDRIIGSSS